MQFSQLSRLFLISHDLNQILNFPPYIFECNFQIPASLGLYVASDPTFVLHRMYHPMGNSDPVVDSTSINSSLSLKENAVFHCKALSYCCPYFVISETFDRRISLLLLLNYLNCFRLD